MSQTEEKEPRPYASLLGSLKRAPILLLAAGAGVYAFLRGLAPAHDPAHFAPVIGIGALLGAALIELVLRKWLQDGE